MLQKYESYRAQLEPYFVGLAPFLRSLEPHPLMALEKAVVHPDLCYQGRLDALVSLK